MPPKAYKSLTEAMRAIHEHENREAVRKAANLRRSAHLNVNRPKGSGPRIAK